MKASKSLLVLMALVLAPTSAHAVQLLKGDDASLDLGGRFQLLGAGENVPDPNFPNNRLYLFLQQSRAFINGSIGNYHFYTEWALGADEEIGTGSATLDLLDFRADIPLNETTYVRVGQFKVPFGKEALTDDGSRLFTYRSPVFWGSSLQRDVGLAAVVQKKGFMGTLGVFSGGSRDYSEEFLPERLGVPLFAARIGYDSAGRDPYYYKESGVFEKLEGSYSTFLNVAYMKDTLIGHSTVLNVRSGNESILLNPNWNPYLAQTPLVKGQLWEVSVDADAHPPIGDFSGEAEFEITHAEYDNDYGNVSTTGARAQAGVALNPFEANIRFAVLFPSDSFAYKGVAITGTQPFEELVPEITFYHRPWSKFVFEAPLQINAPVSVENGVGSYVLMEQQGQTTVIAGKGFVHREFVPELRLMYQLQF